MAIATRTTNGAVATTQAIHAELARAVGLHLPVTLWDGTHLGPQDTPYRIVLARPWAARSLLLPPGDLAAGEAFVHGDVDVDGDLFAAMRDLAAADVERVSLRDRARLLRSLLRLPAPPRRAGGRRASLRGSRHSVARDRAAVAFHYDLPEAFYETFLDANLVYSCAYFDAPDEPLEAAQRRKLDLVARKLRLAPDDRLLDIGCGWGSLLLHAASTYGVRGVGVTLSETQAEVARRRLAAAGLADRVEIRLQDYREVEERFDAVASIGMVEHVGPRYLREYMSTVYELLVDGGRFLNHGITTGTRADQERDGGERDFIGTYVFPDGGLVPAWRTVRDAQLAGFVLVDVQQLRPHYALTLRRWVANLEQRWEDAVAASSEPVARIWRLYMAGSAAAFDRGDLGVVQVLGTKGLAALPLRRSWMEPVAG